DTVDVYATDQDQTLLVAEGVQVVAVTEGGGFGDGSVLTVTLALPPGTDRVPLVHAARAGEVTLVRTTHLAPGGGWVAADRYVLLGLAGVRARWFGEVARWATTAVVPVDFVKVVSAEEARTQLRSGRPFS